VETALGFVESVVGSIAWPLCAVIIARILREPLSDALGRLKKAKVPGFEFDLSADFEAIEENIADAAGNKALPVSPPSLAAETAAIAQTSPAAAIPHAWAAIEQAVREKMQRLDPEANLFLVNRLVRQLREQGKIKAETAEALDRMRKLRNETAYAQGEATFLMAVEYGRKAEMLVNIIKAIPAEV
jgi:hypothetical protein